MGEHPEPHPARGEGGAARLLLRQHPQELLPGPQGGGQREGRVLRGHRLPRACLQVRSTS